MRAVDVIARKRDGHELTTGEIDRFIGGFLDGNVADYQAAAWLMAVVLRGMSRRETADLTRAMAASGRTLDLGPLAPRSVDKHSSGGVGDKISLVAGPIAAACGVVVPKMSGRGLGITGGTLDKLESIPGLRIDLSEAQILRQANDVGFVIAGQTADLAPADGRLYALRDVTATVASLPLIVSSIVSKKLAGGAPSIVLDVKAGSGAFMPTVADAIRLAQELVDVGTECGRQVVAYVSGMDQPLGRAVGNALEVREAIEVLNDRGPNDVRELALTLAAEMVHLAGRTDTREAARTIGETALVTGKALAKLRAMIAYQDGDATVVDDPNRLPIAPIIETVVAPADGYVTRLDAGAIGRAVVALGAGRERKSDSIDHRVGVVFHRKIGDWVERGEPLFDLHLANSDQLPGAAESISTAYRIIPVETAPPTLILKRVSAFATT
jgi:pyrimidine-nucleoside phosphorylase